LSFLNFGAEATNATILGFFEFLAPPLGFFEVSLGGAIAFSGFVEVIGRNGPLGFESSEAFESLSRQV
jgi:hypothetical protein